MTLKPAFRSQNPDRLDKGKNMAREAGDWHEEGNYIGNLYRNMFRKLTYCSWRNYSPGSFEAFQRGISDNSWPPGFPNVARDCRIFVHDLRRFTEGSLQNFSSILCGAHRDIEVKFSSRWIPQKKCSLKRSTSFVPHLLHITIKWKHSIQCCAVRSRLKARENSGARRSEFQKVWNF